MTKSIEIYDLSCAAELADFLYWANNNPCQYSGYCSTSKNVILNDLKRGKADKTDLAVVSRQNGAINGAITCHINPTDFTADCCGPFIKDASDQELSEDLFTAMLAQIPEPIKLNFFFSEQNRICQQLMARIHAKNEGNELVMNLKREEFGDGGLHNKTDVYRVLQIKKRQYTAFSELHDEIFPDAYISGQGILSSIGVSRSIYVIENFDSVLAYGVLRFTPDAGSVAAEIIAVRKEYRGKGLGRQILEKMLIEAFQSTAINQVELVVESENHTAIRLYKKLGFSIKTINCSYSYQMRERLGQSQNNGISSELL